MTEEKYIRASVFLEFAEDMEQTLEVITSEFPIDNPKRQKYEQMLKRLRDPIEEIREQLR